MATAEIKGTKFTFSLLPPRSGGDGFWARTEIAVENEYVDYREIGETVSAEELEQWIFSMFRLLAGAYGKELNLSFEKAGFAIDLYQQTESGNADSREERRRNDCIMTISLRMRSSENARELGGIYTLLLHRKEIETFATALRKEYDEIFVQRGRGSGQYLFAGVSPRGYKGCNYWYLDKSGTVKTGDYVWVRMGRHNTLQIVYVDSVKYYTEDTAPYDPAKVKQVLRKATDEEVAEAFDE